MIDLCCHILPGLNGGAPYLDASVRMAEIAADSNCRVLVTSPISTDCSGAMYKVCSRKQLSDTFLGLAGEIHSRNIPLELRSGMLIHVTDSDHLIRGLKKGYLYPIEETGYVLLDLGRYAGSDLVKTKELVLEMTRRVQETGYKPVYTRPEYMDIFLDNPDLCADIILAGGYFLGSKQGLLGRSGRASQDVLLYMISQGYIAAVASFAVHFDFDTPHMVEADDLLSQEFSEDVAALLLDINPERILQDDFPSAQELIV